MAANSRLRPSMLPASPIPLMPLMPPTAVVLPMLQSLPLPLAEMDLGSAVAGGVEAETTAVAAVAMLLLWCVLLRVPKRRLGLQRKRLDKNHCLLSSAKKGKTYRSGSVRLIKYVVTLSLFR